MLGQHFRLLITILAGRAQGRTPFLAELREPCDLAFEQVAELTHSTRLIGLPAVLRRADLVNLGRQIGARVRQRLSNARRAIAELAGLAALTPADAQEGPE